MSALVFNYHCSHCGASFEASGVPDFSYGEFILRTNLGEEAFLQATSDNAFLEVLKIVRDHPMISHFDLHKSGEIAQKVFGTACDCSPKGEFYHIEAPPICPICSSRKMESWDCSVPPRLSPINPVTHSEWDSMNLEQKHSKIDQAIRRQLGQ